MKKTLNNDKKHLRELQTELKRLQAKLAEVNKLEGKDDYITVRVKESQTNFQKTKRSGTKDRVTGNFFLILDITAKQQPIFIPISIASGKRTAGFMYQVEGTAAGSLATTTIKTRGEGVTQVTLGTLLFAKIPTGKTASFHIQASIKGKFGRTYKLVFTRLNYKLNLTDARYEQYLKELHSRSLTLK